MVTRDCSLDTLLTALYVLIDDHVICNPTVITSPAVSQLRAG